MTTKSQSSDIPIVVDAVKTESSFQMVRCNYLCVECDSPKEGWTLGIGNASYPFLMLGLIGIITRPFGAERFYNVDLIEDLFTQIEDEADLLIDIDDLWLPIFLFENINNVPDIGNVYRIDNEAFTLAYHFREGRLDQEEFVNLCRELDQPILSSDEEMMAFSRWREIQINEAREQYPKNDNFALSYEDDNNLQMSQQI